MSLGPRIPLAQAARAAGKLTDWLREYCHRAQIAGSIRRLRPTVGDIDLVVIPGWRETTDLAGGIERENLLRAEIVRRCKAEKWELGKDGPESIAFRAGNYAVDVYYADDSTFGSRLLCRTGSEAHNVYLAKRARSLGGKWESLTGMRVEGRLVQGDETDLYAALRLPFIVPEDREINNLNHRFGYQP